MSLASVSRLYPVADTNRLQDLCGEYHRHLQLLESAFAASDLRVDSQGGGILLTGTAEGVRQAERALSGFERRMDRGAEANDTELRGAIEEARQPDGTGFAALRGLKKPVMPQTAGQAAYVERLKSEDGLIFGVGPAGTGKTFLAVAAGVGELVSNLRERLIVARPAVEAGEKLGFLPGGFEEKVDPYLLPVWDSLNDLLGAGELQRRREKGEIEVAPLAFMRGRTLKNAFVVIDEAQNTTVAQMKMLLTRLGRNSRMVVTGDPSQVDLPSNQTSGLAHALRILSGVNGVSQSYLTGADVVRHELVSRIISAYERDEAQPGARRGI